MLIHFFISQFISSSVKVKSALLNIYGYFGSFHVQIELLCYMFHIVDKYMNNERKTLTYLQSILFFQFLAICITIFF